MLEQRTGRDSQFFSDGVLDGVVSRSREIEGFATILVSSSLPSSCAASSTSSSSSSSGSPSGVKYIEHRVSKMDTLAGVAIKYGVEVADIKRLNGLVTDLHMYALKSLHIPLPGRHPPSSFMSNGSADNREHTPPRRKSNGVSDLVQSINSKPPPHKVSPAMSSLYGYYGLAPRRKGPVLEGTEMAVYGTGRRFLDDELLQNGSSFSEPLQSRHRKTRSMANGFPMENDAYMDERLNLKAIDNEVNKSTRRRQIADTPELLLKEDNNNGFFRRIAKGLALRQKTGSRNDVDMDRSNGIANGDSSTADALFSVRKSSSTSSLQDSENNSIWPTSRWVFKPDAIARPILEGLPITARRNKAAMD